MEKKGFATYKTISVLRREPSRKVFKASSDPAPCVPIAQRLERVAVNHEVAGSNPARDVLSAMQFIPSNRGTSSYMRHHGAGRFSRSLLITKLKLVVSAAVQHHQEKQNSHW
jgi:hypothetical protein